MFETSNVPAIMQVLPRWVCFRLEKAVNGGRIAKVPYDPISGRRAKSNDSSTWCDFGSAVDAFLNKSYDGVGFQLGDGIFGVDLDGVVENGNLNQTARDVVALLDSYTELSPSGMGVHILCLGRIPGGERRRDSVEMYADGRFFTVTGNTLNIRPDLEERTKQAAIVHERYLRTPKRQLPQYEGARMPLVESDSQLIARACSSSARFRGLWRGDTSEYGKDSSRADLALLNYLAYWTNGDASRMDRLFRQSGLMRNKWDKRRGFSTYGGLTIDCALERFTPWEKVVAMPGVKSANGSSLTVTVAVPVGERSLPSDISPTHPNKLSEVRERGNENAADGSSLTVIAAVPVGERSLPQDILPTQSLADHDPCVEKNQTEAVEAAVSVNASKLPQNALCVSSLSEYLDNGFLSDVSRLKANPPLKTGFADLDKLCGGFYPGLYVLGAVSSLGKTTFAHQICDQVAGQGGHVLFFSLEQTRFELLSKSLSRITAQASQKMHSCEAVTALDIRNGKGGGAVSVAMDRYKAIAKRVTLIEGDRDIASITAHVGRYISDHIGVKPLVVVDYLQIVSAQDSRQSDKQRVDEAVRALKKMQLEHDLPVLVISSLNRASYLNPVDFEGFKESGGIEYTSDVVWGLQLQEIRKCAYDLNAYQKHERIRKAKSEIPRKLELVCLKNRFGPSGYTCKFKYTATHDLFD